tara:strand:+ start:53433 stop:55109 length:1677 start_codon:yes stop_codon:yes gene_type:complete
MHAQSRKVTLPSGENYEVAVSHLYHLNCDVHAELVPARQHIVNALWEWVTTATNSASTIKSTYKRWCKLTALSDELEVSLDSPEGGNAVIEYWTQKVRDPRVRYKQSTAWGDWSAYKKLLVVAGIDPKPIIGATPPFVKRGGREVRRAYSQTEQRCLKKAVCDLHDQLSKQLKANPNGSTFSLRANDRNFSYNVPEAKGTAWWLLSTLGMFRLSLYTGLNTAVLQSLTIDCITRKKSKSSTVYEINAHKARANHDVSRLMSTPREIALVELLLENTKHNPAADGKLFSFLQVNGKIVQPVMNFITAVSDMLFRHFKVQADDGSKLMLSAERFRKNRFQTATRAAGIVAAAKDAGHSTGVAVEHYLGSGNEAENYEQSHAAITVLSKLGKGLTVDEAKQELADELGIELLPLDAINQKYKKNEAVPSGGRCSNPYEGANPTKSQRKHAPILEKLGLASAEEMPCTMFDSCLTCSNYALVDTIDDAYQLLSYKEVVLASSSKYKDADHFEKSKGKLLARIESLLALFVKDNVKAAESKLFSEGIHKFWRSYAKSTLSLEV